MTLFTLHYGAERQTQSGRQTLSQSVEMRRTERFEENSFCHKIIFTFHEEENLNVVSIKNKNKRRQRKVNINHCSLSGKQNLVISS